MQRSSGECARKTGVCGHFAQHVGGVHRYHVVQLTNVRHSTQVASSMLTHPAATGRRFSLRLNLAALVLACVLPAAVVSAALAYSNYQLERANVERQTALVAKTILSDLEREVATIESALKTLATAKELAEGDLRGFHRRARDALPQSPVTNFILTDREGRQVVNTLRTFGEPLPASGTPDQISAVFAKRATVLSDLFVGPVTRQPVIALGVPVGNDEPVAYSLNVGLPPSHINELVTKQALSDGWLVAVLDRSATIVARSRDAQRFVGQKAVPALQEVVARGGDGVLQTVTKDGIPVVTAYSTSIAWGWTVVVGAPKSQLQQSLTSQLWQVLAGMTVAFGLGIWIARALVVRVLSSVRGLNEAALALGRGDPVALPSLQFQEAEAVGLAILQAEAAMKKAHFMAQHDPLTGLANRLMFEDFAVRRLVLAQRQNLSLALLAVDLDGFKAVNDTLGHAAGDEVLKTAARRLEDAVRASDLVARMGGDEFFVLLYDLAPEGALDTAQRMVELLSEPYPGVSVAVSASIGVATVPGPGHDMQSLAKCADQALYMAKQQGKGRAVMASTDTNANTDTTHQG